ncbi:MAG: hypothetical protein ACOC7J_07690, partial [Armatimonadota bacterium]
MKTRAALTALLLLLLALPLCAETYTVDGRRGDDGNDGIAAPFATIARGVNAVGPGDTLKIIPMDEPYRESLRLTRHGLRGAPIVIEGGGATLTGADPAPTDGWTEQDGIWQVPLKAHERMMVFGDERHFIRGAGPTNLQPEQWRWEDGTLYFRPEEGKTPTDYDLRLAVDGASGVITTGAGLIIVRDLTCVNFWNDGFNLHGGTGPMWFENIVGNWNGDEGFSAHENAECYVRGGEFNNNYWHGINDIIFSRTHYVDVVCRDNRSKGVRFNGGVHSLTDCEVSGSPINVELLPYPRAPFPQAQQHPLASAFLNLRNTVVRTAGDEVGVSVGPDTDAVIEHCLLDGGAPVIDVQVDGRAFVANSVLMGGAEKEIIAAGEYVADHNLYHPGRFTIGGTEYGPDAFADYRSATGNDENSLIGEPILADDGMHLAADSPGYRGADSGAYGGHAMGPQDRGRAATSTGVSGVSIVEGESEETAGGGKRFVYDFEQENPWSRVYPVPEQSEGGIAVEGTSELSDEQAHSGARSTKLHVVTPNGEPDSYNIKLFSQYLPFEQPVRAWSFWLYGDGSGRGARPRVRDANGESFYGTPFRIDWEGWRQVTWDLSRTPPTRVAGGNDNKHQDGPTMELVLEIDQDAGSEMTLFCDDLVVELAPEGAQAAAPDEQPEPEAPPAGRPDDYVAIDLPEVDAPALEGQTETLPDGGTRRAWDFEASNPWNRIYPVPEENEAGVEVGGVAELSDEQAHSGAKSGKVLVQIPPSPPGGYQIKLFSPRFQFFDTPIQR